MDLLTGRKCKSSFVIPRLQLIHGEDTDSKVSLPGVSIGLTIYELLPALLPGLAFLSLWSSRKIQVPS